ncbi:hypothetical protein XELAEV_18011187mg [Xenopus laevis]|uniref:Uncharacterized protein n=1 Tax=Xenopus laevis TaxID=8355 RepID=A0A974DK71_XENLA|nr:hypothetical protein XELAEV_18011187mg [Xenopus laevis]
MGRESVGNISFTFSAALSVTLGGAVLLLLIEKTMQEGAVCGDTKRVFMFFIEKQNVNIIYTNITITLYYTHTQPKSPTTNKIKQMCSLYLWYRNMESVCGRAVTEGQSAKSLIIVFILCTYSCYSKLLLKSNYWNKQLQSSIFKLHVFY